MSPTTLFTRSLVAASFCAAMVGCGKKTDAPANPTAAPAPASTTPAAAPSAEPSRQASSSAPTATEKLQGYIECYNQIDGGAHRAIARYTSWVRDMNTGPTGNEKVVYGLYETNSGGIAQCATTLAQTAAMQPPLPRLDAAGKTYIQALSAMDKLVKEAHTYYDRENYKDDQFAKGRALHGPLAASFKAFQQASTDFSQALDVENDASLNAQLAQIEKTEGRKLAYFQMSLMSKAKRLADTIGEEKFDAAKAAEQLTAYESITDEALAYAKAHPGDLPMGHWSGFESATEDMRKAAKERVRRIRDNVPYNEGEKMMLKPGSGWMVDGSVEKLVMAYNGLVSASNSM